MKIMLVVGTRPNFIKAAPLYEELAKNKKYEVGLVHTGQHRDAEMSGAFFKELSLPKPDLFIGHDSESKFVGITRLPIRLKKLFQKEQADLVVVFGDVFSTLAAAWAAKQAKIKVAHVEAGLRSFDLRMPEEINRILVDRFFADIYFATSEDAVENLKKMGRPEKNIFLVGNIMIDTLYKHLNEAKDRKVWNKYGLTANKYALFTLHRRSNVQDKHNLKEILAALNELSKIYDAIIWPIHPRTKKRIKEFGLLEMLEKVDGLKLVPPQSYIDNLSLLSASKIVITDSGGLQEESSVLNTPCVTVRENTERPITITHGTNTLAGVKKAEILKACQRSDFSKSKIPLWDGQTAARIENIISES